MRHRDTLHDKIPWFSRHIAEPWIRWRMNRVFFSIDVHGLNHLQDAVSAGPVILYANHSSWWDGFSAFMLEQRLGFDIHVMMERANLEKSAFLRWMGAFDVNLKNPRGAALALRRAAHLLTAPIPEGAPSPVVVVYPQGRMTSWEERPLKFQHGLEWLCGHAPHIPAIPMACRYEFMREERPHILLRIGKPIQSAKSHELEHALITELDAMDAHCKHWSLHGYERLWQGKLSLNKRWERWMRKFAGDDGKPFEPLNR